MPRPPCRVTPVTSPRRSLVRRLVTAVAVVAAMAGASGCTAISDTQQVVDRARLVNDVATRLDQATEQTYLAEYRLPGGARATIAQEPVPLRIAYTFPSGKYVETPQGTTSCTTKANATTCTVGVPPTPHTAVDPTALTSAGGTGFIPPPQVVSLLTAASLDQNATISQRDTTLAGRHATCVEASGVEGAAATTFEACIIDEGVLGSFKGTVSGTSIDVVLTQYGKQVPTDAFDPPTGAAVTDTRPSPPK